MLLTDSHALLARASIAQDDGQAIGSVVGASADEAETRGLVEVVFLVAVREQLAREDQMGEFVAAAGWLFVLAFHAVQVTVEHARVALVAQQDQRVRERLEEPLDRRRHCLAGLCVVIHDHGDGGVRLGLDERFVEDGSQIAILRRGKLGEIVQQRGVIKTELVVHLVQVLEQLVDIADPELAHEEQTVFAEMLLDIRHKLVGESLGEMLARIEAESLQLERFHDPLAPVDHVADDLRVAVVDVGKHQEVGVAGLVAHAVRPVLVVS